MVIHRAITTKLQKNTTDFFPIFSDMAPPIRQPNTQPNAIAAPENITVTLCATKSHIKDTPIHEVSAVVISKMSSLPCWKEYSICEVNPKADPCETAVIPALRATMTWQRINCTLQYFSAWWSICKWELALLESRFSCFHHQLFYFQ